MEEFYRADPTPTAWWRLLVLLGATSRTYKFALAAALLDAAGSGRDEIPLRELAVLFTRRLVEHLQHSAQAPGPHPDGERDILAVAIRDAAETLRTGRPTERLVDAAVRSMPGMVMRRFPVLPGNEGSAVRHSFYWLGGPARERVVVLDRDLLDLARSEQAPLLRDELAARWSLVEASFTAGIGPSLAAGGLITDGATMTLHDRGRRRAITGVTEAVLGFQHGRCLICDDVLVPGEPIAVDHVFPLALTRRGVLARSGPDLDAVWNLAPAHASCNARKGAAPPSPDQMRRLAARNETVMRSPHPLRRTLDLTLGHGNGARPTWAGFVTDVHRSIVTTAPPRRGSGSAREDAPSR